jgi:S-adenosyl methyltransferase
VPHHHRPTWAPDSVDLETPSAARMYDYYLGGSHNFAADRQLAERVMQVWPDLGEICRANRGFLRRSVSLLAAEGITQFLDLGSGIPTLGNVHEVAPEAVTVYADADPVAVAHGQRLLADAPHALMVHADLREPDDVLRHPDVRARIDLKRPVAILLNAVLHFVPDEDHPGEIVAAYRDACAPGSYLAVSHATGDYKPERTDGTLEAYERADFSFTFRSRAEVTDLFDGYELLPPGLVDLIQWRPDPASTDPLHGDVARYSIYAGVGRV